MVKRHNFNFEGGERLSKIAAWWLVSYMYYFKVDSSHENWSFKLTENSINSRNSQFLKSKEYHQIWLVKILEMNHLDKHQNSGNLNSNEIKKDGM